MSQRAVWKFQLHLSIENEIDLPIGAEIVAVHEQAMLPSLWVELSPNAPLGTTKRTFLVLGTGVSFDDLYLDYRGTAFCGAYVWHVYEKRKEPKY